MTSCLKWFMQKLFEWAPEKKKLPAQIKTAILQENVAMSVDRMVTPTILNYFWRSTMKLFEYGNWGTLFYPLPAKKWCM